MSLERPASVEAATTIVSSRPRAALPVLCVTQVTSWGILYYAFPVFLPDLVAETGWSAGTATAAFSLARIVSAFAGIAVGRILDRYGPRWVMTAGGALGSLALLGVAGAPNLLTFTLAWLLAGFAMAATFYAPAFAALTRWYGTDRVRALTIVTLAGGLASTVFAPLTALLVTSFGWRTSVVVLAGVLAIVVVPLHWAGLRGLWPEVVHGAPPTHVSHADPSVPMARSRAFLMLTAAMTLSGFAMYAVVFAMVPLLLERGVDTATAAWALGLGGLGQTFGRGFYGLLVARAGVTARTVVLIGGGAVTTALLAVVPGPIPLIFAIAMVAGMVRGNLTLLQATAITDRWGTRHYGRLSGILSAPVTVAGAIAPWAGATLAQSSGGYAHVFLALAGLSAVAAGLALFTTAGGRDAPVV